MANNCNFSMEVVGSLDKLKKLEKMLLYQDKKGCFYRVFDAYCEIDTSPEDCSIMTVEGDCAWSFDNSFMHKDKTYTDPSDGMTVHNIFQWCRENNCYFEVWTEEPGCCFVEHYALDRNGNITNEVFNDLEWDYDEESDTYMQLKKAPVGMWEFDLV